MLEQEISHLTDLRNIGLALQQFAESLVPGTTFQRHERRWVARPSNFVTFEVHWQRAKNIALSLRGNPNEFLTLRELPLKGGMAGYSECKITSPLQLAAASSYIARAAELYGKGAGRTQSTPLLIK